MYGQRIYIITQRNKKKKEIYSLTTLFSLPLPKLLSLSLSLSLILSAILGFPKLKIIFNLTNGLHIGRIVY